MNANISVSVICVEAIIYLWSSDLYDCTFKFSHIFLKNSGSQLLLVYILRMKALLAKISHL